MKKNRVIGCMTVFLLVSPLNTRLAEEVSEVERTSIMSESVLTQSDEKTDNTEVSEAELGEDEDQTIIEEPLPEPPLTVPIPEEESNESVYVEAPQLRDVTNEPNADAVAQKNIKSVVETGLNSSYNKVALGYKQGSVVSWKVNTSLVHTGSDMIGAASNIKYSGSTELSDSITTLSSDGTIRFNYNLATKTASLTRVKNEITTLESSKGLTYSYKAFYAYQTWKMLLFWVKVEDRFGVVSQQSKLSNINLEMPPSLIIQPIEPLIDLEYGEEVVDSPEIFLSVDQRMDGGTLTYEWIEKPDTSIIGEQKGKVRVIDTLGSYKHVSELELQFDISDPGSLQIEAPTILAFNPYQLTSHSAIITRQLTNWSLIVRDTRKNEGGKTWSVTAKVSDPETGLGDYLYYVDKDGTSHSLLETTSIFEGGEEGETRIEWEENQGLLLSIPAKNQLEVGSAHQTSIIWNVNEGP